MEEKRQHGMENPELVEAKIYTRRDFIVASSGAVAAAALPIGCGKKEPAPPAPPIDPQTAAPEAQPEAAALERALYDRGRATACPGTRRRESTRIPAPAVRIRRVEQSQGRVERT